jgi:diaminohydroxyphosphoribosylaminopyrimidine deaminase/5-amino-6-(5-phosphoribosylamino)uracil reductase
MATDEKYMYRCLQLARKGEGYVMPNPMVGAVIVHNERIIGEGYHRKPGEPHAEVNAINSVKNLALLQESTLYVSLEPCTHYGKTPPCTELIISKKIPRVVVATRDPNPKVSGKGIQMMRDAGIEVTEGILRNEAKELNRVFFVNQLYKRPYIILKWAQSNDGFIDHERSLFSQNPPAKISNKITEIVIHKLRTQIQGIMVGTNTVLMDNPKLTARKWFGGNPVRITIDKKNKIPPDAQIFNNDAKILVFTEHPNYHVKKENVKPIVIDFSSDSTTQIIKCLYAANIRSVLVEGGARLLTTLIAENLWDEAYIEISSKILNKGIKAPYIQGNRIKIKQYLDSFQIHLKNKISRNFL